MPSSKITTLDLEEPVVEALNTIDTVADQITDMSTDVDSIKGTVESNATKLTTIDTNVNDNKSTLSTINTNTTNINTRLTDTRAANLDLLNNSTYGLSALKTAISEVNTTVSNSGGLSLKSVSKTYTSISYYSSSNRNGGTASGLTTEQLAGLVAMRITAGGADATYSGEMAHVSGSKCTVGVHNDKGNEQSITLHLDNSEYGVKFGKLSASPVASNVKITFYYFA